MSSEDPAGECGAVTLTYLGHAAFLWTAPDGTRVVVDPFQDPSDGPPWFEAGFPPVAADLVVSTHDHFDHNAVERVPGSPAVITGPGEFETPSIRVVAVPEVHAGRWVMPNSLVVVEAGGVRFVHCGDNRAGIDPAAAETVGDADVVMVAVDDSEHLQPYPESWRLASTFSPRVVVPMHYLAPGIVAPSSTLLGIDGWLTTLPAGVRVRRIPGAAFDFTPAVLPAGDGTAVWVFDNPGAAAVT